MPVLLHQSTDIPPAYDRWAGIVGEAPGTPVENMGAALEDSFAAIAGRWLDLGKALGQDASAILAHAPSCAANVSDLGLMLAWTELVEGWAKETPTTLVVCDDPWMFRHLQGREGVRAGTAPGRIGRSFRLFLRGYAARTKAAAVLARTALSLRFQRRQITTGEAVLLVYGHPRSSGQGYDGYFGDLMEKLPHLKRLLHVDCSASRALELAQDGRTLSLHGMGNPGAAFLLAFAKWRPSGLHRRGPDGWLVRRAAALEGGTGQAALMAWQNHCQRKWLDRARPSIVIWPWENHAWERHFVRCAKNFGVRTIGYQHSVVGRQMINYGPGSNPDGMESLPDGILTSGTATLTRLKAMGVPEKLLQVGGALRFTATARTAYDPDGPTFVALPFDGAVAGQMINACRGVAGREFLVKDHPMSPFAFSETDTIKRTDKSLDSQGGLAGVLFAATTVGQEAILAGLPAWRFRPNDRIAMNILPDDLDVPAVSALGLQEALNNPIKPGIVAPETLFAPVAMTLWRELLKPHD